MSKYGDAAVNAVTVYGNLTAAPREAWKRATAEIFGLGSSSQEKGCPRDAFLGLCEEGLVVGIPKGPYTRSEKNKRYAVDAVAMLRKDDKLAGDLDALWRAVLDGEDKQHNSQMDVVVALWKRGLLK